jgi:uncharacterized protein YjdB
VPTPVPEAGYRFVGWTPAPFPATVTQSLTYTADFELITGLTVNFTAGAHGALTGTTDFGGIGYGTAWTDAVTVPAPVPEVGYRFTGWTPTLPSTVTQSLTYMANFGPVDDLAVNFTAGARGYITGTAGFSGIRYGTAWADAVTMPTPVPEAGYRFAGWTPALPSTVIQSSTYTANFELITGLSVNFTAGAHGALTGTTSFRDISYGAAWADAVTVPTPIPVEGYRFTGWTPSAFPLAVTRSLTYTANFEFINAPVKFTYKASGKGDTLLLKMGDAVFWRSSNPLIAEVDNSGLVTFKGPEGTVTITATSMDGKSASVTINAVKNVTAIRTPLTNLSVQKGKSLTLPVALEDATSPKTTVKSKLTWKSSNEKVLTVVNGKIKASKNVKKETNVKVTVTAANGKTLTFNVAVTPKAVKLSKMTVKSPKKMKVGTVKQLKVKLYGGATEKFTKATKVDTLDPKPLIGRLVAPNHTPTNVKVTFRSSKSSVVKVDKAGRLIALKKGKATITIKAGAKSVKKKITVVR